MSSSRSRATSDSGSASTCVGLQQPAVGQVDGDLLAAAAPVMTWLLVRTIAPRPSSAAMRTPEPDSSTVRGLPSGLVPDGLTASMDTTAGDSRRATASKRSLRAVRSSAADGGRDGRRQLGQQFRADGHGGGPAEEGTAAHEQANQDSLHADELLRDGRRARRRDR